LYDLFEGSHDGNIITVSAAVNIYCCIRITAETACCTVEKNWQYYYFASFLFDVT